MPLPYHRYEEIKNVIVKVLEAADITSVPICCFEVAHSLGIQLIPKTSLNGVKQVALQRLSDDGVILGDTIYYDDTQIHARIRFTIMHEIGHIVLDHTHDNDISDAEADFFAAHILVPPMLVYALDTRNNMDPTTIQRVFDVSAEMAEIAYCDYTKWLQKATDTFEHSSADVAIYNRFYM